MGADVELVSAPDLQAHQDHTEIELLIKLQRVRCHLGQAGVGVDRGITSISPLRGTESR